VAVKLNSISTASAVPRKAAFAALSTNNALALSKVLLHSVSLSLMA